MGVTPRRPRRAKASSTTRVPARDPRRLRTTRQRRGGRSCMSLLTGGGQGCARRRARASVRGSCFVDRSPRCASVEGCYPSPSSWPPSPVRSLSQGLPERSAAVQGQAEALPTPGKHSSPRKPVRERSRRRPISFCTGRLHTPFGTSPPEAPGTRLGRTARRCCCERLPVPARPRRSRRSGGRR
jgi:hypothetical protein